MSPDFIFSTTLLYLITSLHYTLSLTVLILVFVVKFNRDSALFTYTKPFKHNIINKSHEIYNKPIKCITSFVTWHDTTQHVNDAILQRSLHGFINVPLCPQISWLNRLIVCVGINTFCLHSSYSLCLSWRRLVVNITWMHIPLQEYHWWIENG